MRLCKHGRIPYYLNGARGKFAESTKTTRVRVARGDSRSNSNLLSARAISQIHDNSIQCNSAQLKALINQLFYNIAGGNVHPNRRQKEILATQFANVISARHWILCNVTEFDCAALLAML